MTRATPRQLASAAVWLGERYPASEVATALSGYLHQTQRASLLPLVRAALDRLTEEAGVIRLEVARPLSSEEQSRFEQFLADYFPGQSTLISTNPDLLSGFRLKVGPRLLDASGAYQLRRLKRTLAEAD